MKQIIFDYKNTGINTIRGIAYFILIIGIIAAIIEFATCFAEVPSEYRYSTEQVFLWQNLPTVILIFIATLFCFGVCLSLSYIGKNAYVANIQREELLTQKGIQLNFIDYSDAKITVKNKKTGEIETISLESWEYYKISPDFEHYELVEE